MSNTGSIIVISNSNKFPIYLDRLMITNTYFVNLDEFNQMYSNFPLTANKILVFESGITNLESIKKFSDIIKNDLSQVGEILFLVGADFREYFLVSLDTFNNKRFISEDITYRNLEALITESKSYELKTEVEKVNVIQRKKNAEKKDDKIDRFQTRVTIDRKLENTKISRESELLNKNVTIEEKEEESDLNDKSEFNYIRYKTERNYKNNNIVVYDSGFNVKNILTSEYSKGRRLMFIDFTDSMFFSFLVENDKTIGKTLLLENIYSEGANSPEIKDFMTTQDMCIIRNSYNLKKSLTTAETTNLIKFIIGRYGNGFDNVFIITDDLKVSWTGTLRYVILPSTIDYLMKFVNFVNKESINNVYVKLSNNLKIPEFAITEQVVKNYASNLRLDNIKVIDGILENDTSYDSSYLFDLVRLETGETEESLNKERRLKSK